MNRRIGSTRVLDAGNRGRRLVRALTLGGVRARVGALVFVAAVVGGGLPAASAHADTADLAVTYQINVAHSGVQTDGSLIPPLSHHWTAAFPSSPQPSPPAAASMPAKQS